jgi:hypothetical protein
MANMQPTPGYNSTWTGALANNQTMQTQTQPNAMTTPNPQPQNWVPTAPWPIPTPSPQIVLVIVQGKAAVDNYPVAPNTTAVLMDYDNRVFWTKRQTADGLGYETVEHPFFTRAELDSLLQRTTETAPQNQNGEIKVIASEVDKLREDLLKLRHEFDDFIK